MHVEVASPPPSPPRSTSITHHHNPQPQVDNAVSTAPRSPASPSAWVQRACRGPHHHHHHHPVPPPSPTVTAAGSCCLHHPALANASTGIDKMRGGLKLLADKVAKGEAEHDEAERWLQEKQTTLTWFNTDATVPIAPQSPARPCARAHMHAEVCITTTVTPSGLQHAHGCSAHAKACVSTVTTLSGRRVHVHGCSVHAKITLV
ncbi:hypothetical protein BJV78DRAFT_1289283 [Lactifluus subvellereus]|nr:hypothetical protein BJV78DRAFT_1289283 [Lactifluus subvellereus]